VPKRVLVIIIVAVTLGGAYLAWVFEEAGKEEASPPQPEDGGKETEKIGEVLEALPEEEGRERLLLLDELASRQAEKVVDLEKEAEQLSALFYLKECQDRLQETLQQWKVRDEEGNLALELRDNSAPSENNSSQPPLEEVLVLLESSGEQRMQLLTEVHSDDNRAEEVRQSAWRALTKQAGFMESVRKARRLLDGFITEEVPGEDESKFQKPEEGNYEIEAPAPPEAPEMPGGSINEVETPEVEREE